MRSRVATRFNEWFFGTLDDRGRLLWGFAFVVVVWAVALGLALATGQY